MGWSVTCHSSSQGSPYLYPPRQCRWQTCLVTVTAPQNLAVPATGSGRLGPAESCAPSFPNSICSVHLLQGALSRHMSSLPSPAPPSGTPTHRTRPARFCHQGPASPSLSSSGATPNIYVSDSGQRGGRGPGQLASFGTLTFPLFSFPFWWGRRLEASLEAPFLGNCHRFSAARG